MKDSSVSTVKDPVSEARRYVQNAKDLLREKADLDTELQCYRDRKYVRMAGNTLWNGVLLILDAVFPINKGKSNRPDIDDYRNAVAKRDLKLLALVNMGYDVMHCSMGYDGVLKKSICQDGIELAIDIIDRCTVMLKSAGSAEMNERG